MPKPHTSASRKRGLFSKEDFCYDPEQDCYWCPAGERLAFRLQIEEKGRHIKYFASGACANCTIRTQCNHNKGRRRITRWLHEELLDDLQKRVQESRERMKLRKRLAEHPFGTIKHHWDQGHFPWPGQCRLTRKLPNVRAEMAFTVLA
jgi:hypothetical protein